MLLVCDAIHAYESLFTDQVLCDLRKLVASARDNDVTVIFTRWMRTSRARDDAVDQKGHWSDYVTSDQTALLDGLFEEGDEVVGMYHTNALTNAQCGEIVSDSRRIVLAGCWTESCILHTARAATAEDNLYPSAVVANACTGHTGMATWALVQMQLLYADVFRI